ncbi:uncharacterized protein [Spinacia oleracea]|uniref:Uncharacterized protein isoform X2 n=1 Tax=Spinacia oleracea TaxID=3562 RepID=A0ABM3RAP8_SPIOL|nr:uncharacterized protein LOC130467816 isoform X2 [Spinacia oleracea]
MVKLGMLIVDIENHHALHKRVDQLCTSAIKWTELKRKTKDVDMKVISFTQQGYWVSSSVGANFMPCIITDSRSMLAR